MTERLIFDIFAIDHASKGFLGAAKSAQVASDKVDGLKRRLDELGARSAEATVGLKGNKTALAQIDELQLKLLRLGDRVSRPKVSLEGFARTSAEITRLSLQLDRLNEKSVGPRGGLISRLLGTGPGGGGVLGQLFPGGAAAGAGGPGVGLGLGIAAAVPVVEALLVELTGLASGLAAATAGIGAFGLLALPTFKAVTAAFTNITAAQKAYNKAQALYKQDPTAANAKAAELALDKLRIAQQGQPPLILKIVAGVQGLVAQFDRMAKVLQPDILKVFNEGLKIASELLPALLPFATAAARALEGLLTQAGKFTASRGFRDWLAQFQKLAGPSITAIGTGIGRVVVALGKLLTLMSAKDVVHAINILFDTIVIAINVVIFMVRRLMQNWDQMSAEFRKVRHDIAHWLDLMRADFKDFRQWIYDDFILKIVRFFTSTLPLAFDLWKETVRRNFDRVVILALKAVGGIAGAFGHLPGFLGAPFRAAHRAIAGELAKIQGDAANAARNINRDWDSLHGKTVTLGFDLSVGAGGIFPTPTGNRPKPIGQLAAGTPGATPGWAWVGERGPELVRMRGGETVIPSHVARGYAGGTGFNFRDVFSPSVSAFGGRLQSAFSSAESQVISANKAAMLKKLLGALGSGGGAGVTGTATSGTVTSWILAAMSLVGGVPGSWLPGLQRLVSLESGGNPFAVDPILVAGQHAEGLWQMLPSTYAAYATIPGGVFSPVSEGVAALRYILGRYGSVYNIPHLFGGGYGGYDHGGWLPPGVSVAVNRTGRPERVLAPGQHAAVVLHVTGSAARNEADQFLVSWLKRLIASGHLNVQMAP